MTSQDRLAVSVLDEREEFLARFRVIPKHAQHGAGDGLAAQLLNASHHHARVSANTKQNTIQFELLAVKF